MPGNQFSIAVLPDTQYYSESYPSIFTRQVQWIVDNRVARNIVFVLHEGDVTDTDSDAEWQNANTSMSLLDGVLPYAMVYGNHDTATKFNKTFSPSRYQALPTFGGLFESGKLDNSFHFFSAGGTDWLIIALEWGPRDAVLAWASNIATQFATRRVIVLVHSYVYLDDTLCGSSIFHYSQQPNNQGPQIFDKFVRKNKNISFVLSGHVVYAASNGQCVGKDDGAGIVISTGDAGNKIYQMLANYQELKTSGLLRVLTFDPEARTVSVETYTPTGNYTLADLENTFQLTNVDLGPPVAPAPRLPIAVAGLDRVALPGVSITLDGSGSVDPDGSPLTYVWDFGDGSVSAGPIAKHRYASPGIFTATLTVMKDGLASSSACKVNVLGTDVLFAEDFNDGAGFQSRWTVVDEFGSTDRHSFWKVSIGGVLEQLNPVWAGDLSDGLNKLGTYVVAGDPAWRDYAVRLRIQTQGPKTIGVLFRYQDPSNYYLFSFDLNTAYYVRVVKRINGINSLIAGGPDTLGLVGSRWYNLEIRASGPAITISIDGAALLSANDPNPLTSGRIGLFSWADTQSYFDDLRVANLFSTSSTVSVAVSPDSATLNPGQTQQFTAAVTGSPDMAVTWSINPAGIGAVSASGLYTAPASVPYPELAVTVTARSTADVSVSASATVNLPSQRGFIPVRVNAGGPQYTDPDQHVWSADSGFTGGGTYTSETPVTGTTAPFLYQSVHWGDCTFEAPVPNGTYLVRLKFAEVTLSGPGQRRFHVMLNGQYVLQNFDIVTEAGGPNIAIDKEFTVAVTSGRIVIQLIESLYGSIISAIEIT